MTIFVQSLPGTGVPSSLVIVAAVGVVGPGIRVPAAQRWWPSAPGIVGVTEVAGGRSGWSSVADQIGDWRGVQSGVMARRPDGAAKGQARGPGVPRLPQYSLQTHKGQRLQNHYHKYREQHCRVWETMLLHIALWGPDLPFILLYREKIHKLYFSVWLGQILLLYNLRGNSTEK